MKKILMFLGLGFISTCLSAFTLLFFLQDNATSGFQRECMKTDTREDFYRVIAKLSANNDLDLGPKKSEQRKTKCEAMYSQLKNQKKMDISHLKLMISWI